MPACGTPGCRGRPKIGDTLCSKCKNEVPDVGGDEVTDGAAQHVNQNAAQSAAPSDSSGSSVRGEVCIVNELLMYTAYHRSRSTRDNLIRLLCSFYNEDEIKAAKDMLWASCKSFDCLEDYVDRRESVNKPKVHAMCEDIYKAIGQVEDHGVVVNFYAADWSKVPKIMPESITDVSTATKLSELEAKFEMMCNKINVLETESKSHGVLIQEVSKQCSDATNVHKSDHPAAVPNRHDHSAAVPKPDDPHDAEKDDDDVHQQSVNDDPMLPGGPNIPSDTSDAGESSNTQGPFLRPTHEIRKEKKQARSKERNSYSHVAASKPGAQQNRKNNSTVTGRATGTGLRSAPSPSRDFFVYRVHKDDGLGKIKNFLQLKNIEFRNVELSSHPSSKFNSYKVAVSIDDAKFISDPNFWEKGICVRKWFNRDTKN